MIIPNSEFRIPNSAKRVALFCGHYGSGKTNLAVNWALCLRAQGLPVALADIDVVNPYFRSKDSEKELSAAGVRVVALPFANSSVDLPSLPSEVYGLVQRRDVYAVLDIGGDERGALALGRFAPYIAEENDYEMFFVVNFFRPLTPDAESAMEVLREIEAATPLKFTAIVNNSNLGEETAPADVESTLEEARRLSVLSGLPLAFTSVCARLKDRVKADNLFYMELQKKII
ncbi:MAG: hypothetical protein IJR51_02415 [Clostridia bacterium]|nr:hypothetical protein [Clostridia bacterium]